MNGGKYSYQFVLDEKTVNQGNSSHAKILQIVEPNTVVLECGPADGIMTRYLKETLGCKVYVLELDQKCYVNACRYADGGVCANLEDDDWMSSFPEGSFDYILYADVLEHLQDPQAVLIKMKRFLKPEGRVILSVPNIANGDIIANLLCDQFTYTPLGLLDNTHIHFFARKNLREMIYESGYFLTHETCTRVPLFTSEQGVFIPEERRSAIKLALMDHPTYNIYQYICCLTQTEKETFSDVDEILDGQRIMIESKFYFDLGEGLSEDRRVNIFPVIMANGRLHYHVELPERCVSVRYDPVDLRYCILKDIFADIDGTRVSAEPLNGLPVSGSVFFANKDPQVKIIPPAGGRFLTLETELIPLGIDSWEEVAKLMLELKDVLAHETSKLEAERSAHEETVQELAISETTRLSLNRACIRAADYSTRKVAEFDILYDELSALKAELEALRNSISWRVTKPLRAIKRALMSKDR